MDWTTGTMGPLLHEQHLPAHELIALIRSLADQVVQSRLDHGDSGLQAEAVLAQSAPVFASLYGLTRATQLDAKESRARTQDARLEMDAAHLRLQVRSLPWPGLAAQRSRVRQTLPVRRICCSSATTSSVRFVPPRSTRTSTESGELSAHSMIEEMGSLPARSSEYQNLPLLDLDDLRHLAASEQPPAGLEVPLPEGDSDEAAHRLMLARLAFELAERKR